MTHSKPPPTKSIELEWSDFCARLGLPNDIRYIDDRYEIQGRLGRGAHGTVHLVRDRDLGRQVALKLNVHQARERFEREARALAKLDHPNVVRVYDVRSEDETQYFTMEYVEGSTLSTWQHSQTRSWREIVAMYIQAAWGLNAAHTAEVIHRDFKPDNAIVDVEGNLRVVDFGLAGSVDQRNTEPGGGSAESAQAKGESSSEDGLTSQTSRRLTETGALVGTRAYASPEQLQGLPASCHSDQFSFCVSLWEALAEERPFTGSSDEQLLQAIESRQLHGQARIPFQIRAILERGLARDRHARFTSMKEIARALERSLERRRKLGIAAAVAVAVLGFGLGARVWSASQQPEPELCEAFTAEVDAVWNEGRRAELAELAEFDRAAAEYAGRTIDRLTREWRLSAARLCEGLDAPARDAHARQCHTNWLVILDEQLQLVVERGSAQTLAQVPDLLEGLVPPGGDYCALLPDSFVDDDIASLARAAHNAAVFGERELARSLARDAVTLSADLAHGPTVNGAAAHLALGDALALASEYDEARAELAKASQYAMISRNRPALLETALWRAKIASSVAGAEGSEAAAAHFEVAEAMAIALELGEADRKRGELELTRGMVAQAEGEHERAILYMSRARDVFAAAGLRTLEAKALNNIGKNHWQLGQAEQAERAFWDARTLLEAAGVPPGHRSRVQVEDGLGILAFQRNDPVGLVHLEHVVDYHGHPKRKLRALSYGIALATELGDSEVALEWAERALAELAQLDAEEQARTPEAIEAEMAAAVVIASSGDPRGEPLMDAVEARAEAVDPEAAVNARCSRVVYLRERGRCREADALLSALDERVAADPELRAATQFDEWRADLGDCETTTPKETKQP